MIANEESLGFWTVDWKKRSNLRRSAWSLCDEHFSQQSFIAFLIQKRNFEDSESGNELWSGGREDCVG